MKLAFGIQWAKGFLFGIRHFNGILFFVTFVFILRSFLFVFVGETNEISCWRISLFIPLIITLRYINKGIEHLHTEDGGSILLRVGDVFSGFYALFLYE